MRAARARTRPRPAFLHMRLLSVLAGFVAAWLLVVGAVEAAPGDEQSAGTSSSSADPRPDFLFGRPRASVGARGTWVFARAGSDLFDFVEQQLTIDRGDFDTPGVSLDVGIAVAPRLEAVFGVDFSNARIGSEYRDYVDNNRLPINQETKLKQVNLSGSIRIVLMPRGWSVSRYAWVPRTATPYVGAGGGATHYEFQQSGDFVDFVDLSVFRDTFQSKGWAPSAHAFGGVDLKIYRYFFLNVEARYIWAAADLGSDFVDFDPIDLAGARIGAGFHLLF